MATDKEEATPGRQSRRTFTPDYARGYQDGYADGCAKGVQLAMSALEELSRQSPPPPTDIPELRENDDIRYLDFTTRTLGVLMRGKIMTISDLQKHSIANIRRLDGAGPKVVQEVIDQCRENSITLRQY